MPTTPRVQETILESEKLVEISNSRVFILNLPSSPPTNERISASVLLTRQTRGKNSSSLNTTLIWAFNRASLKKWFLSTKGFLEARKWRVKFWKFMNRQVRLRDEMVVANFVIVPETMAIWQAIAAWFVLCKIGFNFFVARSLSQFAENKILNFKSRAKKMFKKYFRIRIKDSVSQCLKPKCLKSEMSQIWYQQCRWYNAALLILRFKYFGF